MKKTLTEELKRIHELTYGKDQMIEEDFLPNLFGKKKKIDDPKKADLVSDDVNEFYKTIETAANSGGLSQQMKGKMNFQKSVESIQIGLIKLGYDLPRFGVDGLFGPETGNAVTRFITDNVAKTVETGPQTKSVATPSMLLKLVEMLKEKEFSSDDLKMNIDPDVTIPDTNLNGVNLNISKYVIDYFIKYGGYTPEQASAIAGNLQVESGFNTNIVGDKNLSTPSIGIAQWRESRLQKLKSYAKQKGKPWNDLNLQLSFVIYELRTTHKNADSLIRQSDDINRIAQIVQSKYEISTPQSLRSRQEYANLFYNDYIGNQG